MVNRHYPPYEIFEPHKKGEKLVMKNVREESSGLYARDDISFR